VGGSGYSEFAEYIKAGKMRPIGVTSAKRLPGIDVPTLKESGYDVVLGNWRAVYGAAGITPAQRAVLTEMVVKATKSKSWQDALARNAWTPALLTGKAFDDFVDDEFSSLRGIMHLSGMV
jgi:putative tricarboxylic transport membrane protein